jgi:GntP family gluconate:H+ symporter
VLVILAAAGGLSGILRDSGAAQATIGLALGAHMPPLVLAWVLAAVVRVSMGSATVAMAVASAVLAPLAGQAGVRPELLVLATGTGLADSCRTSTIPGFWMIAVVLQARGQGHPGHLVGDGDGAEVAGLGTVLLLGTMVR